MVANMTSARLVIGMFSVLVFSSVGQTREIDHELIRRIAVFPINIEKKYAKSAEDAWWRVRERLTSDQRFLIASRNFMIQRDVYQSRTELTAADAIILGKILDAHALITVFLKNDELNMVAYDGRNSLVLWQKRLSVNRNRPLAEQLTNLAERLVNDFIAQVPYHGFQIEDYRYNELLTSERGRVFARIQLPGDYEFTNNDEVEWLKISSKISVPTFSAENGYQVVARGRIVERDGEMAKVEIQGRTSRKVFARGALVRIPRHAAVLTQKYAISKGKVLSTDVYVAQMSRPNEEDDDSAFVTALTFIANLATFIVIAF